MPDVYLENVPPAPTDAYELERWEHTRLRRRMLYGAWREDLAQRVRDGLGMARSEAVGGVDLSSNVFAQVCGQLAMLYDDDGVAPVHDDPAAQAAMADLLTRAGWAPLMQRFQRDCLGLREMLLRVDAFPAHDQATTLDEVDVVLRPVVPDYVIARASMDRPDEPVEVREARRRRDESGKLAWFWDALTVEGVRATYRVIDASGADVSGRYLGGARTGDAYPYQWDGTSVLPYQLYHAAKTSMLWDAFHGRELVEGTLQAGLHWTFYSHALRNASWPQRYMVNCEIASDTVQAVSATGAQRAQRQVVTADPATVIQLRSASDAAEGLGQPMVGQWQPGADPQAIFESVAQYEKRVATFAGVSASDFVRQSGDPRSGYALEISQQSRLEAARKLAPVFRAADAALLRRIAITVNARLDAEVLPIRGWSVTYPAIDDEPQDPAADQGGNQKEDGHAE